MPKMTDKQLAVLASLPESGEGAYKKSQSGVAAERLVEMGFARKVRRGVWVGGYYVRTAAGTVALHSALDADINAHAKAEGRRALDEVFKLALLAFVIAIPVHASGWPGGEASPEFAPPPAISGELQTAEHLLASSDDGAPFMTLREWLIQTQVAEGRNPGGDPKKPVWNRDDLRPELRDDKTRECYKYIAIRETLRILAYIHPKQLVAAMFADMAREVALKTPSSCNDRNGPGGAASKAWDSEGLRYTDVFQGPTFHRLKEEGERRVSHRYSVGETMGRCTEMGCVDWTTEALPPAKYYPTMAAVVAVVLFPPSAAADAPAVGAFLRTVLAGAP